MMKLKKLEKKWKRMGISPFKLLIDVLVSDLVNRENRGSVASGSMKRRARKCRRCKRMQYASSSLKRKNVVANLNTNSKPSIIGSSSERLSQLLSTKLLTVKVSKESSGKKVKEPKVARRKSIVRKGRNHIRSNDWTKAKQSAMTFVITEVESSEYAKNGSQMNSTERLESPVYLSPKARTESENYYQLAEIDERVYCNGSNFGSDQYEDSNDIDDSNCSELIDDILSYDDQIGDVFSPDYDRFLERMNESPTTDYNNDIAKNIKIQDDSQLHFGTQDHFCHQKQPINGTSFIQIKTENLGQVWMRKMKKF